MKVILDLDGTLADNSQIKHYVQNRNHDWESFNKECINDKPILPVIELAKQFEENGAFIYIVTGREETACKDTFYWLANTLPFYDGLRMRKKDDFRSDHIVKLEIIKNLIKDKCFTKEDVLAIFDDSIECVNAYRLAGYQAYQIAQEPISLEQLQNQQKIAGVLLKM